MIQKYDLHIHSNKSDGKFSIEDIICLLRIKGIDTFSITDHDSITSISITKRCDLQDLTYISGVEMSSITSKYKAHILGYDIDGNLIQLKELCEKVRKLRIQRIYERLSYLKENYGNASSLYSIGRSAKKAIENARRKVASLINCNSNEIYFTRMWVRE